MHRWTNPAETPAELRPSVVTLGNFDGVHRGHKAVLRALVDAGHERGLPSVAVTFDPHPVAVLFPERAPAVIAPDGIRDELIAQTGVDGLLVMEFTRSFAQLTPEDFVKHVFVDALEAQAVVVGSDTRFGVRNSGDVETLRQLGTTYGFTVIVLADVGDSGRWSSSQVRAAIASGDVATAASILGRPHRNVGTVVHGHHRGRALGFPTANLGPESLGLVPAEGVYAGWFTRLDLPDDAPDRTLPCAISVGTNPTFETDERRTVEAYVLDRDDLDLYGETVMVEFVEHIRTMKKFDSVEELLVAMADDVARSKVALTRIVPT